MTRDEKERRVRGIVGNLTAHPLTGYNCGQREAIAIQELLDLMDCSANFSCAAPIQDQVRSVESAMTFLDIHSCLGLDSLRNLDAAIESLRWLECHLQGRDVQGECVDDSGAKL